jgi:hypothetical protein
MLKYAEYSNTNCNIIFYITLSVNHNYLWAFGSGMNKATIYDTNFVVVLLRLRRRNPEAVCM